METRCGSLGGENRTGDFVFSSGGQTVCGHAESGGDENQRDGRDGLAAEFAGGEVQRGDERENRDGAAVGR